MGYKSKSHGHGYPDVSDGCMPKFTSHEPGTSFFNREKFSVSPVTYTDSDNNFPG